MVDIDAAKLRLDLIIAKARVDLYKPIQIAEVLHRHRESKDIDLLDLATYKNPSLKWRNDVTRRLAGKASSSSANYQHDIWNEGAMPPSTLSVLGQENDETGGAIECYIYRRYAQRHATVASVIRFIEDASPEEFHLSELLHMFEAQQGIRRSVDKAFEIVTYSLFETLVTELGAVVKVSVPAESKELLAEFSDLAYVILGVNAENPIWEEEAHIYRVGVTNAADRGLDMWANFGPAVQVKHLTINADLAKMIVDQVESDNVVLVCRDAEASVIETITKQIGWGKRVRGIVRESQLVSWYDKALRGKFSSQLSVALLSEMLRGFKQEFPQSTSMLHFLAERSYDQIILKGRWELRELED